MQDNPSVGYADTSLYTREAHSVGASKVKIFLKVSMQ